MKPKSTLITGLIFLLSVGFWPLKSQANPIKKERISLLSAIEQISQEYDVYFTFDMTLVSDVKVEYQYKEYETAEEAVSDILRGTDLQYKFYDQRFVILYKKGEEGLESLKKMSEHLDGLIGEEENVVNNSMHTKKDKASIFYLPSRPYVKKIERVAFAVEGVVTDEDGEPLIGVNIQIKDSNTGTSTDFDGKFQLQNIDENAVLVISYIGYQTQEVPIKGKPIIDIIMYSDSQLLDEVVVVGYGSQKKKDLTGSVSSLNNKDVQELGLSRADEALLGKMAGVLVKPVSGEPGAPPKIEIRGVGSISAASDPLFIIDGLPTNSVANLNLNDVESMDVLKDASATAIYGSRGANGVVIINTKRGTEGAPKINFNTHFGIQKAEKIPEFQSALEEAQHYYDGIKNRNIDEGNDISGNPLEWVQAVPITILQVLSGESPTMPGATLDFKDHVYEVLKSAPEYSYELGINGGSEDFKYAFSGEYFNQDGIVINSNYERYSARANFDIRANKKLNFKLNINPTFSSKKNIGGSGIDDVRSDGNFGSDILYNAVLIPEYYSLYDENGGYFPFGDGLDAVVSTRNPLALAYDINKMQNSMRLLGSGEVRYDIMDKLYINFLSGIDLVSGKGRSFSKKLAALNNNPAVGNDNSMLLTNWITETTINYNTEFNGHSFAALLGYTTQKEIMELNSLTSDKFPNNLVPTLSATNGIITDGTGEIAEWSLISYLSRINYNYKGKYYVTGSLRADGSSRFAAGSKYGYFPSLAIAWRLTEESFFESINWLDDLKLRISFGATGNNNIGNYEHYSIAQYSNYVLGNNQVSGYAPSKIVNPNLTWEKQESFNLGFDLGFLNNKLIVNLDLYKTLNRDLLLNVNVPALTGFNTALQNLGKIENRGIEFSISSLNYNRPNFSWSTNLNFTANKNKVKQLGPAGDPIINGGNITMIGEPIGMFYGWLSDGIFINAAELEKGPIYHPGARDASRLGDVRFIDVSGPDGIPDGIITSADKTIMGSPHPKFYYGMTNNFEFFDFTLRISLQGVYGNKILAIDRQQTANNRARFRQLSIMNNYWKSENEPGDGKTPRPNDTVTGNWRGEFSTLWLDDGSYLRINNINFGYNVSSRILENIGLENIRIYTNFTNPFLFTKYVGFNPDVSRTGNALTPGNARYDYPSTKSYSIGINFNF